MYLKLLNKVFGVGSRDEDVALVRLNEPIIHCFVYKCQEEVVVPIHIQQPHLRAFHFHVTVLTLFYKKINYLKRVGYLKLHYWFAVDTKLSPCYHF